MALEVGSPGSINEFAAQHPEFSRKEMLAEWGEALVKYRGFLAEAMGLENTDQLHARQTLVGQEVEEGQMVLPVESAA